MDNSKKLTVLCHVFFGSASICLTAIVLIFAGIITGADFLMNNMTWIGLTFWLSLSAFVASDGELRNMESSSEDKEC